MCTFLDKYHRPTIEVLVGRGLMRNQAHAQSINAVKETAMQSYRRTTPPHHTVERWTTRKPLTRRLGTGALLAPPWVP